METTPPTGTTLETLAPYLPYGIEVEEIETGIRGKLQGLNNYATVAGCGVAVKDRNGVGYDAICHLSPSHCLPVLRPFEDLVKPLPDGTVPLHAYVRFMWPKEQNMRHREYGDIIEVHGSTALYMMKRSGFETGSLHRLGSIYLQKLHFAVGLYPHQYVRKV